MDKFKQWLFGALFISVILFVGYKQFVITTNEIGWLGADKAGRQVLIQSLDATLKSDGVGVDSDFFDRPFILRLLLGESMRTTIRYDIKSDNNRLKGIEEHLNLPYETITDQFQGKIFLQDGYEVSKEDLIKALKEHGAKTIEDFYAGYGFKRFELYTKGSFTAAVEIRGTKNILHAGGE